MWVENHSHQAASCLTCQYFRDQEKGSGSCHRFPPSFAGDTSPVESHRWKFPVVQGRTWCGEHKAHVDMPVVTESMVERVG